MTRSGAGVAFGWLMSKAWSDPQCQTGLVIFLVATAVMALAFAELPLAYTSRSERYSLVRIGPFSNRMMQWAVLASVVGIVGLPRGRSARAP